MNYHLSRQGRNAGEFPLEQLLRRREVGELNGTELVWCEGMSDWQPLDVILKQEAPGVSLPPPLPPPKTLAKHTRSLVVPAIVMVGIVLALVAAGYFALVGARFVQRVRSVVTDGGEAASREQARKLASQPVPAGTGTLTEAKVAERNREFRLRQYLTGYEQRGARDPGCDAAALGLITNWIAHHYGGPINSNLPALKDLSDQLAGDPRCTDPVVLTVAAVNTPGQPEAVERLERALNGFEHSSHRAYPKFYATVSLASRLEDERAARLPVLDSAALRHLQEAFKDGSLRPEDQETLADTFVTGWANSFGNRNISSVCPAIREAGKSYEWLALLVEGEYHIHRAWKLRGGGYANTVTAEGWKGFADHLAQARTCLTTAWELHPDYPLAASRMIYVSLGDSGIDEMRQWFDRTVTAQIDNESAWKQLRWGLRPRWYGSHEAMLALGETALRTGRFDTDVPREYFQSVIDVEGELELPAGERLFGRDDIWPNLQRMYEGYISEPAQEAKREDWRSTYAVVSYLAGKPDSARSQLEVLHWKPSPRILTCWGRDLSLMPLEVAARTGSLGSQIAAAERLRRKGDLAAALEAYAGLAAQADDRTRAFVRERTAALKIEARLAQGEWVDFLPADENLAGWHVARGEARRLDDGALEVKSGPDGHLFYSRVRMARDFEARGTVEVVQSSTKAFQAGLVMGMPEVEYAGWYAFRLEHRPDDKEVVSFSQNWSQRQILDPAALNAATNSFHFRFHNGLVSATVNGREIFKAVKPPKNSSLPPHEFCLGIGAANDLNHTVIRYRDLQVRRRMPL